MKVKAISVNPVGVLLETGRTVGKVVLEHF